MSEAPYNHEAQIKQALGHYLMRAQAYMQMGRWSEAQQELNEALTESPNNADALFEYAYFHFIRWQQSGERARKAEAVKHLQLALVAKPNHERTLALQDQIAKLDKKLKFMFWLKTGLSIIVVPAMAGLALLFLQEEGWLSPLSAGLEGLSYKVPATFVAPSQANGINFSINSFYIKHGEHVREQKHLDYSYTGIITSDSFSVERLSCHIQFVSEDGDIVAEEYVWFLNASSDGQLNTFKLYPGDHYFFHHKQRWGLLHLPSPTRISRVIFQPDQIVLGKKPQAIPQQEPLAFNWRGPLPRGLEVGAFLREDSLHIEPLDSIAVHFLQIELNHQGQKPCQEFTLMLAWKDTKGNIVKERDIAVVTPQNKPWIPGQRIAIGWQEFFNSGEHSYPKPFDIFYVQAKAILKD